jgi:hypothetical protein
MRGLMCRAAVVTGAVMVLWGLAVGVASAGGGAGARTRLAVGGIWGKAREVPGTSIGASTESVSCPSTGNCSAGGSYNGQAFVVSKVRGAWGTAEEVPGTAALNQGGSAAVTSVSCATAGNCSAGGEYTDSSGRQQVFVVSEVSGTWGTAEEVPGTAALNQGGFAGVNSVSCASAGNCSAGGYYTVELGGLGAFVVSEVNGTWGKAREVPGIGTEILSVSCASAGTCSAGGGGFGAVVSEVNGTWGKAEQVPGLAALNHGESQVFSVSCASAGNCSVGGYYTDRPTPVGPGTQAFVDSQVNGIWDKAREVPGTAALNQGGAAGAGAVSCPSAGNCSANGEYRTSSGQDQAFVDSQVNGIWGKAREVPGTAALNQGGAAGAGAVSCGSAGNCSAGGDYTDSSGHGQVFVVNQVNGTWRKAEEVPGTAKLNQGGNAQIASVSCATASNCSAGGSYTDSSGNEHAFVVNKA